MEFTSLVLYNQMGNTFVTLINGLKFVLHGNREERTFSLKLSTNFHKRAVA